MNLTRATDPIGPDFVLDLDDPAFAEDPYPTFRRLREHAPVYEWKARRALVFSRHADVKALLNDRAISPDQRFWEDAQPETWPPELADYKRVVDHTLFRLPADDHARVRKLVSAAMGPRSVERMRGSIQRAVDVGIEASTSGGRIDIERR